MKIVAYDGVSKAAVGLAVALYRMAKRAGRRKVIKYGYDTIIATPKKVLIVLEEPVIILINSKQRYAFSSADLIDKQMHKIKGHTFSAGQTAIDYSTKELVTSVGGIDPIFDRLQFSIVVQEPDSAQADLHVFKALWKNNYREAIDTYFTPWVLAGPSNYLVYVNEDISNAPNRKAIIRFYPRERFTFYGTDADGEPVMLCRADYVLGVYEDPNEPLVEFPVITPEPGWWTVHDAEELSKSKHYKEHYVIIPIIDMLRHLYGINNAAVVEGVSNSVSEPDVTVEYTIGYNAYTIVITQGQLAADVDLTEAWSVVGTIAAGSIPPAEAEAAYTLSGTGATNVDGTIVISGARFEVVVDGVNIPGAFETVYMPQHLFGENKHTIMEDWQAYSFFENNIDRVETTLYGYKKVIFTHGDDTDYSYLWSSVRTAVDHVQYSIAIVSQTNVITVSSSNNFITEASTASNVATHVAYIDGELVDTVQTPVPITSVSGTGYYYADGIAPRISTTGEFQHKADEQFFYDGATYTYDNGFFPSGPVVSDLQLTLNPTVVNAETYTGYEQNRELRSWWHDPIDAEYGSGVTHARLIIKSSDGFIPVHTYRLDGAEYKQAVYINGALTHSVVSEEPVAGPASNFGRYTHGMSSKLVNIEPHLFTADQYSSVTTQSASGGATSYAPEGFYGTQGTFDRGETHYTYYEYIVLSPSDGEMHPMRSSASQQWNVADEFPGPQFYDNTIYSIPYPGDPVGTWGYQRANTGVDGTPYSDEGFTLFPVVYGATGNYSIIHWKGATANADGICIVTHSGNNNDYQTLFDAFIADESAGATALDNSMTVVYNNFASPAFIRYFAPGACYTIHTTPPE